MLTIMLKDLNTEEKLIDATGKDMDIIAGGGGDIGWTENWGPEIITKEIISRIDSTDKVLDLGSGSGRASHPFSLRGIDVIVVDLNKERLQEGEKKESKLELKRQNS